MDLILPTTANKKQQNSALRFDSYRNHSQQHESLQAHPHTHATSTPDISTAAAAVQLSAAAAVLNFMLKFTHPPEVFIWQCCVELLACMAGQQRLQL
jgi:hypothetical protein